MSLYTILLVDDEEEIRLGIKKKIDWESNGFCLVGDASNGIEALELAKTLNPDVIMTDIKMPYMDGLELCREVSSFSPTTKLVIFSGFDDFEYAKQAIKANVCEYILKPINASELNLVLSKLKGKIDAEYEEKLDTERLRKYYNESLPLLKEQFYIRLLEGRLKPSQIISQSEKLQISFSSSNYVVTVFKAETKNIDNSSGYSLELIPVSLKEIIEEQTKDLIDITCLIVGNNVATVMPFEHKGDILHIISLCDRICKIIYGFLKLTVTAGVGFVVESPKELRRSYLGAFDGLDYRAILGTGGAVFIEDVEPDFSVEIEFDEIDERTLYRTIKLGSKDEIRSALHEILSKTTDSRIPISQYQIFILELQVSLIKLIKSANIEVEEIFGRDMQQLYSFGNLPELESWLFTCCVKINEFLNKKRLDSSKIITDKAQEYILLNYNDSNISLEILCEHLNVSPAYFSSIFKKETGISFVNFLTTVRMEKAAKLLQTTDDKTYLIAEMTGYNDPNYFSYVFKKHFGIAPSQYRSAN